MNGSNIPSHVRKNVKYMYSKMRIYDTGVKEKSSKNCLIDRMIAKKFKYHERPVLQIVYVSYIRNHKAIIGRPLYCALLRYFDKELKMNINQRVISLIRMAQFTPAITAFLEEFYSLFLLE